MMSAASGPYLNNSAFSSPLGLSANSPHSNGLQKDTTLTKIFVGGLPYHTTDESLRKFFEQFGTIEEAVVITDRQTGKSRGYGFVTMARSEEALLAIEDPNPCIDGRKANVNLAVLGAKPRQIPGVPGSNGFFNSLHAGLPFAAAATQAMYPSAGTPASSFNLVPNIGHTIPPATSPASAGANPLTAALLNASRCNPDLIQSGLMQQQPALPSSPNQQQQQLYAAYLNLLLAGQSQASAGGLNQQQHLMHYYTQLLAPSHGTNGSSAGFQGFATGSPSSGANGNFDLGNLFPATSTVSPQNMYMGGQMFNRSSVASQETGYDSSGGTTPQQQLLRINLPNCSATNGAGGAFLINSPHADLQLT